MRGVSTTPAVIRATATKPRSSVRALCDSSSLRSALVLLSAAARENGMSYSTFISGLKAANVEINRKLLAEIAVVDTAAFARLAEVARSGDAN